jgi:hypothetical protein
MKRFLDPNLPAKKLWRHLDSVGMRETVDDNIIYTPDQMNIFFATPQAIRPSNTDFNSASDSPTEEFAFIKTFELEVYNAIHYIRSNAVKFLKIILPYILPYVTHVFNTIFMSSSYPASWKLSKIMPVAKTNNPGSLSDYRLISILPALSKSMEVIMWNQITAHIERNGMMSRLQPGFRSNHSPSKNNK